MLMTTNGATPASVRLVNPLGTFVHTGPGLKFPVEFVMPAGSTNAYDPRPIVGEPIDGDYLWFRLTDGRGFLHRSALRPA